MTQRTKFQQVNLHVDNDSALIFQHSLVKGGSPLTIRSGANQIIWGYSLLTQVTPTYGGEVQQILGARIEELEINGQTRDNHQLEQIYDWFRAYMTMASGFGHDNVDGSRSELPITFSYPSRKWQFDIQVIDASGFQVGTGLVATQWSIKAIIVPPGENQGHILEKTTMDVMTKVIMPKGGIPIGVGYNTQNPYSDAAYGGLESDLDALGHTIGDNFHRLLGAYSVGDFSRFAFEGAAPSAYNSLNQESKDYFTSIYNTDIIPLTQGGGGQTMPGGPDSGGSAGGYSYTAGQTKWPGAVGTSAAQFTTADGPPNQLVVVAWLASNAIKAGLPPLLPIMAAMTESALRNLPDGDADSKGFFQMRTSDWLASYPNYPLDPDQQIKWFITQALAKKSQFPGAMNEATQNAENLGQWCQAVEISKFPDRYSANYEKAKQLLNQSSVATAGPGASPDGVPQSGSIRSKAIGYAKWMLANASKIDYDQSGPRLYPSPPALPFSSDCSGSVIDSYVWAGGTNPGATYTGDMLTRLTHITATQAMAGDMVVVGSGNGHHAIMLLNKVGNDWNCFSHGGPSFAKGGHGPHTTPLSYYAARDTITYLRWPGNIDKAP